MIEEAETTLDQKQYDLLRRCSEVKNMNEWNEWRTKYPETPIQLVGADFENASLENADLEGADLRAANLQNARLTGANFREANLNGTMFFRADLRNVDFQGAFLYGADLSGVVLEGANFFDVDLAQADLRGAKLSGLILDTRVALDELAHPLSDKQKAAVVYSDKPVAKAAQVPVDRIIEKPIKKSKVSVIRSDQYRKALTKAEDHTPIVRSVMFDRVNVQAGFGILTYFSEILRQKYEDETARIVIEQEGLNVKVTIETFDGERKAVEKAFEQYIAVVTGREQLSGYLSEPLAEFAFKQKLNLIHLELKQTAVLHSVGKVNGGKRSAILEESVERFYTLLSQLSEPIV